MILIPLLRAGPHSIGQAGADHFLLHVSGKTDDEVKLQSELFACAVCELELSTNNRKDATFNIAWRRLLNFSSLN